MEDSACGWCRGFLSHSMVLEKASHMNMGDFPLCEMECNGAAMAAVVRMACWTSVCVATKVRIGGTGPPW